jgi:hypothetical protein
LSFQFSALGIVFFGVDSRESRSFGYTYIITTRNALGGRSRLITINNYFIKMILFLFLNINLCTLVLTRLTIGYSSEV